MVGDPAKDRDDRLLGQECEQSVGDQYRRAVGRNGVRPLRVGQRYRHRMRLGIGGQHLVTQRGDAGQVDAVPVHRRRRGDAIHAAVDPGAEVDHDGIRMLFDERPHPVVEHLGAKRRLAHHAGLHTQPGEVVVDLADGVVGKCVAKDRPVPSAVQCAGVRGEKRGLFDGCQCGRGNSHACEHTPVSPLNVLPKTFTALAITSPSVGPRLFVSLAPFGLVLAVLCPVVLELLSRVHVG